MEQRIFKYPVLIRESHLDTFGHVNNAVYLELLEEARWELITANGYGLDKIKETGIGPTLLEINIQFLKEIKLRDEIIIETKSVSYEKKILNLEQRILRGGELCCAAKLTLALFDLNQRKIIPPTKEWLAAIDWRDEVK